MYKIYRIHPEDEYSGGCYVVVKEFKYTVRYKIVFSPKRAKEVISLELIDANYQTASDTKLEVHYFLVSQGATLKAKGETKEEVVKSFTVGLANY